MSLQRAKFDPLLLILPNAATDCRKTELAFCYGKTSRPTRHRQPLVVQVEKVKGKRKAALWTLNERGDSNLLTPPFPVTKP